MHSPRVDVALVLLFIVSSCNAQPINNVSLAAGLPSPTPFQPIRNIASDPYADAAPTPLNLPSVTPAPPMPTQEVILPEVAPQEVTLLTDLNPLTGLPPADPALLDRRPLAIKVANYPRYIRPQSGLTLADNIYEYYIEGGLTRFIAVFYGNTSDWVGPVRSGRYFDENIQRMYQAFLVFKFADPRVLTYFEGSDFSQFIVVPSFGKCPPFKLLPEREIEVYNNSYFYTPEWDDCIQSKGLDNNRPVIRSGFFDDIPPIADLKGAEIYTYFSDYSYSHWSYDPTTLQYLRFQETDDIHDGKPEQYAPLVDRMTSMQVHAVNVVFLFASYAFSNTFDQEDEVYKVDLTGSGEAYVFRDGLGIVARWQRTNTGQPLSLTAANGTILNLRPGITFYEVLGSESYVDQDAGEWHFHHATP